MSKYLLAHDLGTSGNKVTLFDTNGKLIDSKVYPYDVHYFNNGWVEQNPDDWWHAVCKTTKDILKNLNNEDVIGVSFSGQMMGCLPVDRQGDPLRSAIIWADVRAQEEEKFLRSMMPIETFYKTTGHKPSSSYSLAKFLWIKNNEPEIYQSTYKILNSKDYIISKLTGHFVTDYSDASGTNILDLNSLDWSDQIIQLSGIDKKKLPELKKSTDIVGYVTSEAEGLTGLKKGTPVVCGGGDGSMAAVGAMCIKPGTVYSTVGTSSWNALTTENPLYDKEMRTFNWAHIVPGYYVPCGTMQAAGASLSWMKNEIARIETQIGKEKKISPYHIIDKMVESSTAGSNGTIFLPYLMGERSPRWDADARGAFVGLKMETQRKDIMRSVMEGVALNLNVILDVYRERMDFESLVITGGGARSKIWCQIFADVYNTNIEVPDYLEEATSMGAAVTAGVGIGIYKTFDAIHDFIKIRNVLKPNEKNVEIYSDIKPVFEDCYEGLQDVYVKLAKLKKVHR